jgi:multiple sugar transport system ATP-binding protein
MVAGLEGVDEGTISIGGRNVNSAPASERGVAMVFQNYALYPHKTVLQNIGFHLLLAKVNKREIDQRARATAAMLGLTEYLQRRPSTLSGGQRQRVAMGRAIVRSPEVFLMDEPLSALDAQLRVDIRTSIAAVQRSLGATTLYVTHDQVEAMTLGDRVAVMHEGRLQQCGTPAALYQRPANVFVASFLGSPAMNLINARLTTDGAWIGDACLPITPDQGADATRPDVVVGVRPEDVHVVLHGGIPATVDIVEFLGNIVYAHCSLQHSESPATLIVRLEPDVAPARGSSVQLAVHNIHLFDATDGRRLGA